MKISLGKKILWGLILVAATPFVSNAQEETTAQVPLQLTLDKAIEIALSESPTIKVAEQEIKRVDYSKKSAASHDARKCCIARTTFYYG